ncbi:MAG: hypothetical protein HOG49_20030 [Candidatus Scalindua sp.]|jgi:hypothetical protein|nr:hypothetical protein [Candidatus Scalindua sp.]
MICISNHYKKALSSAITLAIFADEKIADEELQQALVILQETKDKSFTNDIVEQVSDNLSILDNDVIRPILKMKSLKKFEDDLREITEEIEVIELVSIVSKILRSDGELTTNEIRVESKIKKILRYQDPKKDDGEHSETDKAS